MKKKVYLSIVLFFLMNYSFSQSPEISKYTTFLEKQEVSARDYVLKLFEKYDIVILCERFHPETTQYDLIYDIVSSPYFQSNVGYIFTEIGSYSNRQNTLDFTKTKFTDDSIKQVRQAEVYRNGYFPPLWYNTNFYDFTGRLNSLNSNLKEEQQVNLLTSGSLNPTAEQTKDLMGMKKYVMDNYVKRDSLMADYIIQSFDSLSINSKRKKALVIMNYRHAFSKAFTQDGNVGAYLFEKYPGRVANVYLNGLASSNQRDGRDKDKAKMFRGTLYIPIQEGKWDASFKIADKDNIGFDFKDSPFGKDHFDIWSATENDYNYEDIFTGLVFYLPLEKHRLSKGVRNFLLGVDFEKLVNEWNLFNKALNHNEEKTYSPEFEKAMMEETSTLKVNKYPDLEKYEEIINQWIKNK